jgi:hypothetical protein
MVIRRRESRHYVFDKFKCFGRHDTQDGFTLGRYFYLKLNRPTNDGFYGSPSLIDYRLFNHLAENFQNNFHIYKKDRISACDCCFLLAFNSRYTNSAMAKWVQQTLITEKLSL